jgi:redox-sensitive bicupin YhaK (pirin superfamily)
MGGHLLDQPLPVPGIESIDPFLLIHHWDEPIPPGGQQSEMGVGPHPHRGFSPVTFIFKGTLRHQDSQGNTAVISEGGTQWMHAGRGIVHSERPGIDLVKNGGDQEFIQFWVNTPSKYKMEAPYYLPIKDEDTPKIIENGAEIAVVAGTYKTVKGPAKIYSPQILLRVKAEKHANLNFVVPKTYNTLLYVLNGGLSINEQKVSAKEMVWFENDGEFIKITSTEKSNFIILSGEPINENVCAYGPFVMNSQDEVNQAILDYQNGKMGTLNERFDKLNQS